MCLMKIFPVLKVFISSKNLSFICYARLCAGYFYIKRSPKENFPIKEQKCVNTHSHIESLTKRSFCSARVAAHRLHEVLSFYRKFRKISCKIKKKHRNIRCFFTKLIYYKVTYRAKIFPWHLKHLLHLRLQPQFQLPHRCAG